MMTPFLGLVLCVFTVFMVVLGSVSVWASIPRRMAAVRQRRTSFGLSAKPGAAHHRTA